MQKLVRFGGPNLGFGQRTWFDDLHNPVYSPDDIEQDRCYGQDAIDALSRGGATLLTTQSGGRASGRSRSARSTRST